MQRAKAIDNVNVRTHAQRAAERVGTNGRLQHVVHAPQPSYVEALLDKLRNQFSPEVLDVAGRAVKGFVVPHWAAGVLLAAILASGGFMYRSMSGQIEAQSKTIADQTALLIRLDQRLIDKDVHDGERVEEFQKKFQNVDAVQIVMNRDIQTLKIKAGLK